jgi:hypothetical protein
MDVTSSPKIETECSDPTRSPLRKEPRLRVRRTMRNGAFTKNYSSSRENTWYAIPKNTVTPNPIMINAGMVTHLLLI